MAELLFKGKKDLMNMYGAGITSEQKAHVQWASSKLPNENWSLWATRAHRANPAQFTPETKEKIEHFAGSQHIPEVGKVRFEKHHDLNTGMKMLEDAEGEYNKRIASNTNVVKPSPTTKKIMDAGNGMGWYSLGRGSCSAEGKAMGHCGNVPSEKPGDRVLSLRTEHKGANGEVLHEPHATFIVNGGYLGEMKGRGNTKPGKKYHQAIGDLLLHPKIKGMVGGGYLHHQNFNINDLEPAQRQRVLQIKPNISVYDNNEVPGDLPEKFEHEVKPVIDFRNKLKSKYEGKAGSQPDLFEEGQEQAGPKNWREGLIHEIKQGNSPKMALNALHNPTDDELHDIVTAPETPHDTRVQAAMSGTDSARLHGALANTKPEAINYLNNPNVDAILNTKNDSAIESLAGNSSLSEKDVDKIIGHSSFDKFSEGTHSNLTYRDDLNPKYNEKFVNSPHANIRRRMAEKADLDPKFHDQLANDPSDEVRNELAENKNLAPHLQDALYDRGTHMASLSKNPNLSPSVGNRIAEYAAKNDPEKIESIADVRGNLLNNESTSSDALRMIAKGKKVDERTVKDLYGHKNLPKDLFDKMVEKHSAKEDKYHDYHSYILGSPHLTKDQFKELKSKYGRKQSYSSDFKNHPFYEAKESEINPTANGKMLENHLNKLKEKDPEKYIKTQDKLISQAVMTGDLKSATSLISAGVLDDEHHKKLHDTLQDIDSGDHHYSPQQSWSSRDYEKMLHDHLEDTSLPTSYHDESLNRLSQNGEDPDDIGSEVFDRNRDEYYEDANERADEIARNNYPFEEHLDNIEQSNRRSANSTHPLDAYISHADEGRHSKVDLSDLRDMAHERAMDKLSSDGKVDEDGNYKDSDYDDASSDAMDSVHSDVRHYLEHGQGEGKFSPAIQKQLEKYRDKLFEDHDEATRDGDGYNYAHDEAMSDMKNEMDHDPDMWPKHLRDTKWVKENIKPKEEAHPISDDEEAPDESVDDFGVKKTEEDPETEALKKRVQEALANIKNRLSGN